MSESEPATKRKKTASEKSKPPGQPVVDSGHRKRRRNRTTQSCLNCHTSKRMCDRNRPACARCTQLGLSGLCVYEVDDPTQRSDTQDESSRLLKRVAELEAVIRELKNKPHPRWASSSGTECNDNATVSSAQSPSTSTTPISPHSTVAFSDSPTLCSPSPMTPASDSPATDSAVNSIFAQSPHCTFTLQQHLDELSTPKPPYSQLSCSCLLDLSTYQTMLELSLRLRKAVMVLGQYPLHHQADGYCLLNEKLAEFDILTTNALSSVSSPSYNTHQRFPSLSPPTLYSASTDSTSRLDSWVSSGVSSDTTTGNDLFMSWEPHRLRP
ncbi:hypothetical protein BDP27DRAFT_1432293 [Rhodocollybia butyracea]|uniref:Zn(2)-C6 fungal-type domain-containing protein n=1 Tax=Rhodocollybia butyracea TaxID=206335 RepID=A0A9P5P4Q5_9AGAR|nr:hypothetical protein BDP27DRAFT_1432293 [Rhodocollybia butyracea]